ncbi:DUF6415 family natural product biosynthesis protein [Streptomyces marianii]|uniref:Restriction endonuclease n=1 Tax=Streptomyces marianii TaxID=1817406 RepID=A0A5R9DSH1_9ACTN|nr:DUF6415 family natural product biosynthesis protein [Streptomyces marianii]TLQ38945.1 restriction endonuclease [Streptomyces marianii]
MSTHTVLYDPEGLLGTEVPLDREPHTSLVKAVLAWTDAADVPTSDCAQIALQLTGHARAVASDVQRHVDRLAKDCGHRAHAEIVLAEAERRLSTPSEGTVRCVKNRARLVRALYERLDRLSDAIGAASPASP